MLQTCIPQNIVVVVVFVPFVQGIIKKKFGGDATLIGDEGGFAPPCDARQGVELIMEAIEKAGYKDWVRGDDGYRLWLKQYLVLHYTLLFVIVRWLSRAYFGTFCDDRDHSLFGKKGIVTEWQITWKRRLPFSATTGMIHGTWGSCQGDLLLMMWSSKFHEQLRWMKVG